MRVTFPLGVSVFVYREDRIELGGMSGDGSDVKRDAASTSDTTPNGMVRQSSTVDDTSVGKGVQYSVEESPPWHMSILLGFQVHKLVALPRGGEPSLAHIHPPQLPGTQTCYTTLWRRALPGTCPSFSDPRYTSSSHYSVEESPPWHMSVLLGFQVHKLITLLCWREPSLAHISPQLPGTQTCYTTLWRIALLGTCLSWASR